MAAPTVSTAPGSKARQLAYWGSVRRLTLLLAGAWFGVTLTVIFFARELAAYTILGWPFSFYMAAQGSTLVYVLIIGIYAWRMKALDSRRAGRAGDVE